MTVVRVVIYCAHYNLLSYSFDKFRLIFFFCITISMVVYNIYLIMKVRFTGIIFAYFNEYIANFAKQYTVEMCSGLC